MKIIIFILSNVKLILRYMYISQSQGFSKMELEFTQLVICVFETKNDGFSYRLEILDFLSVKREIK